MKSLQDQYAPHNSCFGCGPSNSKGLQIKSMPTQTDEVVATWKAQDFHEAFPGVLSGGIIGTLLDCHCNWTATYHLMKLNALPTPPCTVTADYAIKLLRPTPTDVEIHLSAKPIQISADRATIEGTLTANGKVCATCTGTFVAVKPGHPAYHRW